MILPMTPDPNPIRNPDPNLATIRRSPIRIPEKVSLSKHRSNPDPDPNPDPMGSPNTHSLDPNATHIGTPKSENGGTALY